MWGQKKNKNSERLQQLGKLQDKARHIIHFLPPQLPLDHIYHKEKILKLRNFISLQNALLIKGYFGS